jgi:hypothetical protein
MFHSELPFMVKRRAFLYGDFVAIITHSAFHGDISIVAYNLNNGNALLIPTNLPLVSM